MSGPADSFLPGAGSQPGDEDGAVLSYMQMPNAMATFAQPALPEPDEVAGMTAAKNALQRVRALLEAHTADGTHNVVDLATLDAGNIRFVDQMLGEGEVSVVAGNSQAQESVLAGVWRIRSTDDAGGIVRDVIEVASFPTVLLDGVFTGAADAVPVPTSFGEGVFNAPPLLPEINEHIAAATAGATHVINLSLLPHTEQDLALLDGLLGRGTLVVLSRGYGNCRVTSTSTRNVWWARFYNSQDALILNTIEVTAVPELIRAAPEDIADSAGRLHDMLEAYR